MNKKAYQTPSVDVMKISHQILCQSEVKTSIAGGSETPTGGWNAGQAQGRRGIWNNMRW